MQKTPENIKRHGNVHRGVETSDLNHCNLPSSLVCSITGLAPPMLGVATAAAEERSMGAAWRAGDDMTTWRRRASPGEPSLLVSLPRRDEGGGGAAEMRLLTMPGPSRRSISDRLSTTRWGRAYVRSHRAWRAVRARSADSETGAPGCALW